MAKYTRIVAVEEALRDLRKRYGRHLLGDEYKMVGRSIKFFEHVRYRIHGGDAS